MNAKKAKAIRRRARAASQHLPERTTTNVADKAIIGSQGTQVLTECQRGAYKALKRGKFKVVRDE